MSASFGLQKLVVDLLKADSAVADLAGGRVYDRVPEDKEFPYISIGPHDVVEDDAECITAGAHTLQLDIWSRAPGGFGECKQLADAAKGALHNGSGEMEFDALVEMRVELVRFLRDPDGQTSHGVLTLSAMIEEAA